MKPPGKICFGTIDDSWNLFADILTRLINEHIAVCKDSPSLNKNLPYINRETKDALRKKNKAWRNYLYCKTIQNFDNYKLLRNKATSVIRKAKYSNEKELAPNIKYASMVQPTYLTGILEVSSKQIKNARHCLQIIKKKKKKPTI